MSGPTNYNHTKLTKPIDVQHYPWRAAWYLAEPADLPTKSIKMTKNCFSWCKLCAIKVDEVLNFNRFKNQDWKMRERQWGSLNRLAIPNFDIEKAADSVYISGSGNGASMMFWDGQWWIVYGTRSIREPHKNGSIYILHNVLKKDWSPEAVNKIKQDLVEAFAK